MTEPEALSLKERLDKIKSPNLQNQKEVCGTVTIFASTDHFHRRRLFYLLLKIP